MDSEKAENSSQRRFSHSERYSPFQLITVFIFILFTYIVTSPPVYRYGVSNQASQLPLIKHVMDPSYLANDWVVSVRTGFGSPRYYYTQTVGTFSEIVGLSVSVFILYSLSLVVIIAGIWLFTNEVYDDKLAATVTVGLILAQSVTVPVALPPNLGGNSLISSYLIPSHLANAFILISLVYAVKSQYRRSFGLLGIATLIHIVNGFWIAVTIGLCVVAVEAGSELRDGNFKLAIKNIPWDAALIYGVISSLAILPALATNISAESGFEAAYIIAWVRHPHHYVLSTWSVLSVVTTLAFISISILLIYHFRSYIISDNETQVFVFTYIASIATIMFLGGYVFTEIISVGTIIKLQPYRIDDFLYLMLYGGIAKLIVIGLHQIAYRSSIDATTFSVGVVLIAVILATVTWTIPVIMTQMGSDMFVESHDQGFGANQSTSEIINEVYISTPSHSEDLEEAYTWIETETPTDAVFLAPPGQEGFRLGTSRARVVNLKSFPFPGDAPVEWEQRMNDVCSTDIRQVSGQGSAIAEKCDSEYNNMTEEEINHLSERYEANWILTKNESYDLQHEYSTGEYHIYRIESSEN